MSNVEHELRLRLGQLRYPSSRPGVGMRALPVHVLNAIVEELLPYISELDEQAWKYRELCK